MSMKRRFVIGLVAFGCSMAMLYLLWNKQFVDFYTVLIGAAYFYVDRVHQEDEEDKG